MPCIELERKNQFEEAQETKEKEKHPPEHPWLRVLYNVKGYYVW
jgi:hypothetical protein